MTISLNRKTRAAAYKALLTLQPIAVAYGFISQDLSALWVSAIPAVGIAVLALFNLTPDAADEEASDSAA